MQKYAINYRKAKKEKEKKRKKEKEKEELHFNGILKAVNQLYRHITRRILSKHLEMLSEDYDHYRIIDRDPLIKAGSPRFYRLAKNTKIYLDLELPIPTIQSQREKNARRMKNNRRSSTSRLMKNKETTKQKNKNVYLLLMSLATIGFMVPEPVENASD